MSKNTLYYILPVMLIFIIFGGNCFGSKGKMCEDPSVKVEVMEQVGIKIWENENPVEKYAIAARGLISDQTEVIKERARPYILSLNFQESRLDSESGSSVVCKGSVLYGDSKILVKYSVDEYDLGKTKDYKVNLIEMRYSK